MAMDYKEIEDQALDVVQLSVPEVTDWVRDWTNAGRRSLQDSYRFREMLQFHPAEADIGTTFQTSTSTRALAAPARFVEFATRNGDLFLVDDGQHKDLELGSASNLLALYDLDDTGEPDAFYIDRASDGTITFQLFPAPDAVYDMRLWGYFYLADLADGDGGVDGVTDFMTQQQPLLLRDLLCREAYTALEMWDAAREMSIAIAGRLLQWQSENKVKELGQDVILRPTLAAGPARARSRAEQGYPFWPRRT